jgi:hypothetical protein
MENNKIIKTTSFKQYLNVVLDNNFNGVFLYHDINISGLIVLISSRRKMINHGIKINLYA